MKAALRRFLASKYGWAAWPLWTILCFLAAAFIGGLVFVSAAAALGFGDLLAKPVGLLVAQTFIYVVLLGLLLRC
jgi:hypothetical protein